MTRRPVLKKTFSVTGAELKRHMAFRKACHRYRVLAFLEYVEGGSESIWGDSPRPEGYDLQSHFQETLRALADALTNDEIIGLMVAIKYAKIQYPGQCKLTDVRERLP